MKGFYIAFFFIMTYSGLTFLVCGQSSDKILKGKVLDKDGKPIPFATVAIKNTNIGTVTKENGEFSLIINDDKAVELLIRSVGYRESTKVVQPDKLPQNGLIIMLEPGLTAIDEVIVREKSETTLKKELPFAISAIDTKPLQIRNLDVNGILSATTGVKIREEGGLGSGFVFSLNGFSGNQIKFFMDGIPMDNFGSSLSLNNIPVNLISSIEVYKGVIPVELGIDALGGAVNIITNQRTKSFLDFSYSLGSFNTHRASVISRHTFSRTGIQVNVNAFYNYSDNNYKILAEVPDPETGSIGAPVEVTRFHDAYKSMTAQVEVGVVEKKYADKLLFGAITSNNYKEVQTGLNMTKVAGQLYTTSERTIFSLKYKKNNLLVKNLDANVYATYLLGHDLVADTSSRVYNWLGNYSTKEFGYSGELNWDKTLFRFDDRSASASANISYTVSPVHSFVLNNTNIYFRRVGEDPLAGHNAVPFSKPNVIEKNITGLAYNLSLWEGKLKSSLYTKYFFMDAMGYEEVVTDSLASANNITTNMGFGFASTYFILTGLQVKTSYENTYRLPEPLEMFGDGGLKYAANPNLVPEHSRNINVSLLFNKQIKQSHLTLESTYLYRLADDMIKLGAEGVIQGTYENYTDAKVNSFEGEIQYRYKNKLRLSINGTYQNIVNNKKKTSAGGENYLYGDRLPNIPYLFGNASMGYQFPLFRNDANKASIDWSTHFVEAFYLKAPSQGESKKKKDIPRQLSHSLSLSFLLGDGKYNISLACTNITDNELYDNFRMQKPGRAFSVKLRYFLTKY